MSVVSCQKTFSIDVNPCGTNPDSFAEYVWNDVTAPLVGVFSMVAGDGVISMTATPVALADTIAFSCCNPTGAPYPFTVEFNWTGSGFTFNLIASTNVGLDVTGGVGGLGDYSPGFNSNGAFSYTLNGILPIGTCQLRVFLFASGGGPGVVTGTCAIRPLNPP